ncbi:MAG: HDIG domain-containing protein [Bacteroidetes bacterium]|nr:HDIG domain-containing protein [Bacteroidota bacterium]
MKKLYSFLVNRHPEIFRYLLALLVIVLITNWFPKIGKFKYEFEKGRPWKHESLLAPFDFTIKKSDEEIMVGRQKILEDFIPYYQVDNLIYERNKAAFVKVYAEQYSYLKTDSSLLGKIVDRFKSRLKKQSDSLEQLQYSLALLDNIYNKGIIDLAGQHRQTKFINILNNNLVKKIKVSEFLKLEDAYKLVIDTLKRSEVSFIIPIIENHIHHNILYNDSLTERIKSEQLNEIMPTRGKIQKDAGIISRGDIVTDEKYQILISLKDEYETKISGVDKGYLITIGYGLISSISIILLMIFLAFFEPKVFNSTRRITFVLLIITLITLMVSHAVRFDIPSYYVIPYCILPIILRTFFGTRLAMFAHITVILLTGFMVPVGFEFQFIQLVAGFVAIFTNVKAHYWSQFFISIGLILLTYNVSYMGVSLIQEGNLENIEWLNFGWIGINIFLTLLAYPLIPIFEKTFGFLSEITLVEIGDLNKPLLKQLSLKAPGSFQHSLQVANLAEAAAYEIGANTLLVRVGSLYHDIGKMEKPLYFIENQVSEVNPHDELPLRKAPK